ncbi:zinc finger transcription factor 1 [Colletotrichum sojae]|uniref:Zinc finger transcription factor 1 n=1 Tax=Colletotrichum sojae TaxID=2175907 RepID=A0A8H6IT26_9PEZI|nr:zinc finger transcription factor 1 [Colletotrichum sojae]
MPSPEPAVDAALLLRPRCLTCKRRKLCLQVKCTGGPEPCDNCRRLRLGCTFNYPESVVSSEPGDPRNLLAPTETLTEAGTRRRRIAAACIECRAQKAKCSGHRPQCFHCSRRNLVCVYPSSPSRRKGRAAGYQAHQSASPESSGTLSQTASYEAESTLQNYGSNRVPSLNTSLDQTLLSTDVIRQHLEVFFDHIYPLGYDFFHRPSMMEEFYAGKLPPILCTSICAAAAIFVSRSRESRVLSIQWAREVDGYIFANLNVFKVLNIQLMVLSKFQNFAYRQFGKVWLLISTAARLCVSFQLNDERPLPEDADTATVIRRECERRLVWHVWWVDKALSAGFDEFTCIPDKWMRSPLPNPEHTFRHGLLKKSSKLGDGVEALGEHDAGARAYIMILFGLRCKILRSTKAIVLESQSDSSPPTVAKAIATLKELQDKLANFLSHTPSHIQPNELNMFSHSTTPEFSAYITLNSWYLQSCCDLFRTCLPGHARESAAAGFIDNAPPEFVSTWRALAVSHALRMARLWEHLQSLRAKGALHSKQTRLPIGLGYGNMVHQCTKTLLTARRHKLYDGLIDPITDTPVELNDDIVDALCESNAALLDDMANVAPIIAVLQGDVKKMIENEKKNRHNYAENPEQAAPVSSEVQRHALLSRYHPLSQSFDDNAKTVDEVAIQHSDSPLPSGGQGGDVPMADAGDRAGSQYRMHAPSDIYQSSTAHAMSLGQIDAGMDGPLAWSGFAENQLAQDYYVAPSQFDMGGELSWFLSSYIDPDPNVGASIRPPEAAP